MNVVLTVWRILEFGPGSSPVMGSLVFGLPAFLTWYFWPRRGMSRQERRWAKSHGVELLPRRWRSF